MPPIIIVSGLRNTCHVSDCGEVSAASPNGVEKSTGGAWRSNATDSRSTGGVTKAITKSLAGITGERHLAAPAPLQL